MRKHADRQDQGHHRGHGARGFGLIEILVTLGILTFGTVSATTLQAALARQSAGNRARAEALALAQARLDEIRTEAGMLRTPESFATALTSTASGFTHGATFAGTNAEFTRTERIDDAGRLKTVTVRVAWPDRTGEPQSLELTTRMGYTPPQRIGAVARISEPSPLKPPGGSAATGNGTAPDGALIAMNDDGTLLYRHGSDALALVAAGRVVLLLPQACATSGTRCTHLARIDGRVWIDRATQPMLEPGTVGITASGVSWCMRYYIDDGVARQVTLQTRVVPVTANGDYAWFDYSCYVGSGWYGNVGLTFQHGFADTDRVCIGDPLAPDAARMPALATHRAYRGLLYRHDATVAGGKERVTNPDGTTAVRLYSHGIAAGAVLPEPGATSHDFVIGAFAAELDDGAGCITQGIMMRPDARIDGVDGALFAGMPAAFVCLNGQLDTFDSAMFGHDPDCPDDYPLPTMAD